MDKAELVAHMADLIVIMEFHEKLGTTKNPYIMKEFEVCNNELLELLTKEQEGE